METTNTGILETEADNKKAKGVLYIGIDLGTSRTSVAGSNGGNALGFIPGMGGYFVYSATPDL